MIADILAEQATLGSILLSPGTIGLVLDSLTADDFYDQGYRETFRVMTELAREGRPIDYVSIASLLRARGQGVDMGGYQKLLGLTSCVASAANLSHHAAQVRSRARLRRLAEAATEIAKGAESAEDADAYIAHAQSRLLEMTEDTKGEVIWSKDWATQAFNRIELRSTSDEPPSLITGLTSIDRMRVMRRGSVVTIAGRPAMGKTSLAQNIALGAAHAGSRVLFVSIEMGEEEIETKFIGARSGIATRTIEWPKHFSESDWPRLARAIGEISGEQIGIWIASSVHIDTLRLRVRRLHAQQAIDFVFVDYIQLMSGDHSDNRALEIASITRGLKVLAKEIDGCVVAISQLNRDVEKRKPPIPMLSDLRESGSIEQDSDAVIFVYRPSVYDEDANINEAQAIAAKHRHGAPGSAQLFFEPAIQRFSDVEVAR